MFNIYQVSVEYMKHLYGKCCASLGLRRQPTLMSFYNYVYQRLTHHPESYVDNMLAPKKRVSGSPGYESELRQWCQSEGHRKKRKQRHDRVWEKHLPACLELKEKFDPKNNEPKTDYLPERLRIWCIDQRHNHKVYLDSGEVDTGRMTKEWAKKLLDAGIVRNLSVRKTWDENLEAYLELKEKFDPKNNEPKADYLPEPLCKWWANQRQFYKVYLEGGKVDTGKMTKERAKKLLDAGIVRNSSMRKTWHENLAAYLELKGKKDPENTKSKNHHLPKSLCKWWVNQRMRYKVYLDSGEVDTGTMNKERADKLLDAGIVVDLHELHMHLKHLELIGPSESTAPRKLTVSQEQRKSGSETTKIMEGPSMPPPQHQQPLRNFGYCVPPPSYHQVPPPPPQHSLLCPPPPPVHPLHGGNLLPCPYPIPPPPQHQQPLRNFGYCVPPPSYHQVPPPPPQHSLLCPPPPPMHPLHGGNLLPCPYPPLPHNPQGGHCHRSWSHCSVAIMTQSDKDLVVDLDDLDCNNSEE